MSVPTAIHSNAETIAKALTGSYRAEHALDQAPALYDAYGAVRKVVGIGVTQAPGI